MPVCPYEIREVRPSMRTAHRAPSRSLDGKPKPFIPPTARAEVSRALRPDGFPTEAGFPTEMRTMPKKKRDVPPLPDGKTAKEMLLILLSLTVENGEKPCPARVPACFSTVRKLL